MQSYNTKFVPTLVDAYKHEGIGGMYKGLCPRLLATVHA